MTNTTTLSFKHISISNSSGNDAAENDQFISTSDPESPSDNDLEYFKDEDDEIIEEDLLSMNDLKTDDPVYLYLNAIGRYKIFTAEEEREHFIRLSEGDEKAREEIINHNLRLVANIAKRYADFGLSYLDVIQEGNLGLIKATHKYDYTLGYKFSTYATWWIKQTIVRAIADQARTIRIPVHLHELYYKIITTEKRLMDEKDGHVTDREISQETGISLKKIRDCRRFFLDLISLDVPIGENGDEDLTNFIRDDKKGTEDIVMDLSMNEEVRKAVDSLSERERDVIILRFGLDGGGARTLESIAAMYGVTRERIRQIEAKALRKLRNPKESRALRTYWKD